MQSFSRHDSKFPAKSIESLKTIAARENAQLERKTTGVSINRTKEEHALRDVVSQEVSFNEQQDIAPIKQIKDDYCDETSKKPKQSKIKAQSSADAIKQRKTPLQL